ncbi:MAG: thioesterase family protein [Polaribacter sp.]|uniref:acyl-CoA thioesterase n=1 Tax=Polaribacter sp. TaxID=1920175 RepID=UPI00261DE143|nr:thioesterase family protein [uncultured Polaribacter sp.]
MKDIFELEIVVNLEDIDVLNHVNNVVYVKWMDKVAFEHWAFLTRNNPLPQFIWVVLRHEIDYVKQAVLGDKITVKTWVGETKGFKSERYMEFYKNNDVLVKAKTIWGMLDTETYKPSRIRENVLNVLQPPK